MKLLWIRAPGLHPPSINSSVAPSNRLEDFLGRGETDSSSRDRLAIPPNVRNIAAVTIYHDSEQPTEDAIKAYYQNVNAALDEIQKLAGMLIEMVLKTDPENIRIENGQFVLE